MNSEDYILRIARQFAQFLASVIFKARIKPEKEILEIKMNAKKHLNLD